MIKPDLTRVIVVVPMLNEATHIAGVIDALLPFARRCSAKIIVADGGSTDGSRGIVQAYEDANAQVVLIDNPDRIQSCGVNLAVKQHGQDADWLIRVDAHSAYPKNFCEVLLDEAARTGADSVVVGMLAKGNTPLQRAIAFAQNSRFGNGGASHRLASNGKFVDHGHHALMRVSAFLKVGGYDPTFSHNEDAELDLRLRKRGFKIWLTDKLRVVYYPRRSFGSLVRQYYNFGRGRAQNMRKHHLRPGLRQLIVITLAPALTLAAAFPLSAAFALPLLLWVLACLAVGVLTMWHERSKDGLYSGIAAGCMHAAWSCGYWSSFIRRPDTLSGARSK